MTKVGSKRSFSLLASEPHTPSTASKRRRLLSSTTFASSASAPHVAPSDPLSPLLLAIQHLHPASRQPTLSVIIKTHPLLPPSPCAGDESPISPVSPASPTPSTPSSPLSPLPEMPDDSSAISVMPALPPAPTTPNSPQGRWPCHLCSRHFKTKGILKQHLEIHRGPIECSLCDKHFTTTRGLQEHLRVLHFKCKRCGDRLADKRELETHEKLVHGVQRRSVTAVHMCGACGRKFSKRFNLVRHQTNQACRGGDEE